MTVYAVHPGIVRTELKRHMNLALLISWKIVRPFTKTVIQGAQTSIYCAVEPSLDSQSGGYYWYSTHNTQIQCCPSTLVLTKGN